MFCFSLRRMNSANQSARERRRRTTCDAVRGWKRRLFSWLALSLAFTSGRCRADVTTQIGLNFIGATFGVDSAATPPDSNGVIGPAHFVEFINGRFAVFDKLTGVKALTITDLNFWKNAGVTFTSNLRTTDPRVLYDPASSRWFASQVDFDPSVQASNRFLIAVSATADPTGAWNAFAFAADPVDGNFADFPTLGLDANGVYLAGDMFDPSGNGIGSTLVAIPKSDLLANPPTIDRRRSFGIMGYDTYGEVLQPTVSLGATAGGEAILAVESGGNDFVPHSHLVTFTVQNAATPDQISEGDPVKVSIPAYTVPINPPQPSGQSTLDDGDARLGSLVYRVGDLLYAVHGLEVSKRAAIQWFVLNANDFSVVQTGLITDPSLDLFYPSIAANAAGVAVIGCNASSRTSFISCNAYVGETVNGVLTFGSRQALKTASVSYSVIDSDGVSRWGDYSATSVDPKDPTHFWTIQMYPSASKSWSTQITELIVTPVIPVPSLTITPTSSGLTVSWPTGFDGFQLQTAPDLSSSSVWTPVVQAPVLANTLLSLVFPNADQARFFRLVKP